MARFCFRPFNSRTQRSSLSMFPRLMAFTLGRLTSCVPLTSFLKLLKPSVMMGCVALVGMSSVSFSLVRLGAMTFVPDVVSKMTLWSKETAEIYVPRLPDLKETDQRDQLPMKEIGILCGGAFLGILWLQRKKPGQHGRWLGLFRWLTTAYEWTLFVTRVPYDSFDVVFLVKGKLT